MNVEWMSTTTILTIILTRINIGFNNNNNTTQWITRIGWISRIITIIIPMRTMNRSVE